MSKTPLFYAFMETLMAVGGLAAVVLFCLSRLKKRHAKPNADRRRLVSLRLQLWVSVLVGILAFLAWVPISNHGRYYNPQRGQCLYNLSTVQSGLILYALQNQGKTPSFSNGAAAVYRTLEKEVHGFPFREDEFRQCPGDWGDENWTEDDCSYRFVISALQTPKLLAYCRHEHWYQGKIVRLAVDGVSNTFKLSPEDFRRRLQEEGAPFEHIVVPPLTLGDAFLAVLPFVAALLIAANLGTLVSGTVRETYRLRGSTN
ncbi:MAG: hypothetical protein AAF517_23045 [Planctomycetota bacterium]